MKFKKNKYNKFNINNQIQKARKKRFINKLLNNKIKINK